METSTNTVERFRKAINDNRFFIHEELEMINILVNKYNFISVSEYARQNNISQPAALKRIDRGKVMYVEMIGKKFIIN
jgi:hypothetical protein